MADTFPEIDDRLATFIAKQHMFFVATAPSGDEGLVNLSPKGQDSFRVLGPTSVAYLDLTGSGVETIAHLRQNGRIVIMFCAFEGPPRIVRIHGEGEALVPGEDAYEELRPLFPEHTGARAIIRVEATRISDSCGYAVPLYDFKAERDQLERWACNKGEDGLVAYREQKNARSLDGLPGLG